MKRIVLTLLLLAALAPAVLAEPFTLPLYPNGTPNALGNADADHPSLTVYQPATTKKTVAGILVCPGGGYGALSMKHEGSDVAEWLNNNGVAAFVLKYRIHPYQHPAPLQDAQQAMRIIRSHAREWKVNQRRLGVLGFSAGGHLASSLATHYDRGDRHTADSLLRQSCRPDFAVLIYPVITMEPGVTHGGSRLNLLGTNPDPALEALMSNEKQVTKDTPPTFLVHSRVDPAVPVANSIRFHDALVKAGVPTEMQLFDVGGHGFGLAPNDPVLSVWTAHCLDWLRQQKLLPRR